jgi:hypothetical protein
MLSVYRKINTMCVNHFFQSYLINTVKKWTFQNNPTVYILYIYTGRINQLGKIVPPHLAL